MRLTICFMEPTLEHMECPHCQCQVGKWRAFVFSGAPGRNKTYKARGDDWVKAPGTVRRMKGASTWCVGVGKTKTEAIADLRRKWRNVRPVLDTDL